MTFNDKSSRMSRTQRTVWIMIIVIVGFSTFFIGYAMSFAKTTSKIDVNSNYWGKEASDTTSINIDSSGKCKWGTNGNQCITAGEYLNWCVSAPRNNVTINPLVFCTDLMTHDLREQTKSINDFPVSMDGKGIKRYFIDGIWIRGEMINKSTFTPLLSCMNSTTTPNWENYTFTCKKNGNDPMEEQVYEYLKSQGRLNQ